MRTSLTFAFVSLALVCVAGCPKDDSQPPPIPSATVTQQAVAAPVPPPAPVEVVAELDAAPPVEDVAPDVKKTGGKAADVGGLRACCTALKQNAASMPEPNKTYAEQAAALCQGLVASGVAGKASAIAQIAGVLKGANLPPACR